MKVYQINSVCGIGSTGRIALDLADVLKEHGDTCRIGYGRGNCGDDRSFRFETDMEVNLHGVLSRATDRQGFYSSGATKRLIADIRAYSPDVIHLHNIHGYYLNIELLFHFLKAYDRPVVWTLHDCWAFTGHCAYFDYIGCDRWKTGCHSCPQKRCYPVSVLADNARRNFADKKQLFTGISKLTVVTPSRWLRELALDSFLGKYDILNIPNGIDLSIFKPAPSDVKERLCVAEKSVVLGVANVWDDRKGLQDFIQLSSILPEKYQIVLVGLSEKQIADLPDGILGIKRTESARELAELYSAADVFVNPTYEDNFPTTNLEALACGTPVITYNTGGSPESLSEQCGIVIEKCYDRERNVRSLRDAICSCSFQRESCASHGAQYEKTQQFEQYIRLYHQLYQE